MKNSGKRSSRGGTPLNAPKLPPSSKCSEVPRRDMLKLIGTGATMVSAGAAVINLSRTQRVPSQYVVLKADSGSYTITPETGTLLLVGAAPIVDAISVGEFVEVRLSEPPMMA